MRRAFLGALIVGLVFCLAGCGTAVPKVTGMNVHQVENTLKAAGFALGKVTYDEKATAGIGSVVSQLPMASGRAKAGSAVQVVIAGPSPVAVPRLVGLKATDIDKTLVASGLSTPTVTESYDALILEGMVISQKPAAGTEVAKGSTVAVVVSKGREPVAVPAVVGKSAAEAQQLVTASGFVLTSVSQFDKAAKGTVIAQAPAVGDKAVPGTTIQVTVSDGRKPLSAAQLRSSLSSYVAGAGKRNNPYHPESVTVQYLVLVQAHDGSWWGKGSAVPTDPSMETLTVWAKYAGDHWVFVANGSESAPATQPQLFPPEVRGPLQ